ncbi:hypothetical protein [Bdellovibrio sp. HCB2-146]|uniref:hypothetical protein n=1 Tax=Bdellovibrio sp. HCB2-146 TaxID=3394362 RepID=UPI0039BD63AF
MKKMFKFKTFFLGLSLCISSGAFASGTIVGNGGDPIFAFMRATRDSMVDTVKLIVTQPAIAKEFCILKNLSTEQIEFCRKFFFEVAPQILRLSQGQGQIPFVLREEPLHVLGPDGKPMIVSARTELGPAGAIEIHRDSVKTMAPSQVLFLIVHEFEHKVLFEGRSVTDNEVMSPFASGRDLLDAVASAVVAVAKKKGMVGSQFGIRDIFQCIASSGATQFGAQLLSSRLFQSEDLMSYETSVGRNPTDGSIFFREDFETVIRLKFTIVEPNNCGEADPRRQTIVQVLRSQAGLGKNQSEQVLSEVRLDKNPMCPQADSSLSISYKDLKFSCNYFGSEGTTAL